MIHDVNKKMEFTPKYQYRTSQGGIVHNSCPFFLTDSNVISRIYTVVNRWDCSHSSNNCQSFCYEVTL